MFLSRVNETDDRSVEVRMDHHELELLANAPVQGC